jgi:hypothetical protein
MTKKSGLGDNWYVDAFDLSGDVGAVNRISGGPQLLEVTAINKNAYERIGGLRIGGMEYANFFNPSAGQAHAALKTLPTTDSIASYFRGTNQGDPAASCIGKRIDYAWERGADGSLSGANNAESNGFGLEWGEQLTSGRDVLAVAGSGTGLDYGAGVGTTNFGLQSYMHVFAFTGTSATVNIQSSTDNGSGDAYATITGGSFAAVSAVGSQRIQTGRTAAVERWLRYNVTGTFSNFDFALVVVRNDVSVVF